MEQRQKRGRTKMDIAVSKVTGTGAGEIRDGGSISNDASAQTHTEPQQMSRETETFCTDGTTTVRTMGPWDFPDGVSAV